MIRTSAICLPASRLRRRLLISMAVKILIPLRRKPAAVAIAVLGFIAIALLRFPLLPTMLVLTPLSIYLASKVAR